MTADYVEISDWSGSAVITKTRPDIDRKCEFQRFWTPLPTSIEISDCLLLQTAAFIGILTDFGEFGDYADQYIAEMWQCNIDVLNVLPHSSETAPNSWAVCVYLDWTGVESPFVGNVVIQFVPTVMYVKDTENYSSVAFNPKLTEDVFTIVAPAAIHLVQGSGFFSFSNEFTPIIPVVHGAYFRVLDLFKLNDIWTFEEGSSKLLPNEAHFLPVWSVPIETLFQAMAVSDTIKRIASYDEEFMGWNWWKWIWAVDWIYPMTQAYLPTYAATDHFNISIPAKTWNNRLDEIDVQRNTCFYFMKQDVIYAYWLDPNGSLKAEMTLPSRNSSTEIVEEKKDDQLKN